MSILIDLTTSPYNSIKTMDEFYEEYKKSNHLYRLIEFIVLCFLNAKFAEKPVKSRAPININPYTLELIFNPDFKFDWIMADYFQYKLRKCKHYIKRFLSHTQTDLTIEQNKSLFLNLQTLTPRHTNTRVWGNIDNEVNTAVDNFRLFAFNVKYNDMSEFLFHMTTNMFSREYDNAGLICTEQTSGSVLANGNIGCFVVALWAAGLIDTDMYLYILQGFENIFNNSGSDNDAVMYSMNIFLTQTLIRLYKNRNTTIKVYDIPYMFNTNATVLKNTFDMIVYEIETRVKELLEQLEISSRHLFHTNPDGTIGYIKVALITIIRYTPLSNGFAHTFNLIIQGNSTEPLISIADFYENKAITNLCSDGTLKYKNVLLQRQYNATMSEEFEYTSHGETYNNIFPIAPLNRQSIMSILLIQQHERDDGNFQLFCEVTTDVKDGQPFFNIDPRFLLNNDTSVTRAKEFLSRIKKTQKTKRRRAKKFVNTIKKRLGKPLLASSPRSSSSSIDSAIARTNRDTSNLLAQQFALSIFSNNNTIDEIEAIMDNPNFDCNKPIENFDLSLIPHSLTSSKSLRTKISKCVEQKNTPMLILVGSKFTDKNIRVIIKLLDMNCVNINYINSVGDNALLILLKNTNTIVEELENAEDDYAPDEYEEQKELLTKDYDNHIFLAMRLIEEGADVNYGNGTTPLEYAVRFKSKQLLKELLDKGVTASSMRQGEMIDRILHSSSSKSSKSKSKSTPSDLSSISFSSLDLLDRETPLPPIKTPDALIDIKPFDVRPPTPLTPKSSKSSRKKSKKSKSTGSLPSLDLDEIVI